MHGPVSIGGEGEGRIGRCELQAHEEGGEADKGGYRGAGIGVPGARHVGEHVVVRALEGDAPLLLLRTFQVQIKTRPSGVCSLLDCGIWIGTRIWIPNSRLTSGRDKGPTR